MTYHSPVYVRGFRLIIAALWIDACLVPWVSPSSNLGDSNIQFRLTLGQSLQASPVKKRRMPCGIILFYCKSEFLVDSR